jgi:hypothetical protein
MKFKKTKTPIQTSDPYYDLFDGGDINPEKILADKEEAKKVREAIETILRFLDEAQDVGAIEYC